MKNSFAAQVVRNCISQIIEVTALCFIILGLNGCMIGPAPAPGSLPIDKEIQAAAASWAKDQPRQANCAARDKQEIAGREVELKLELGGKDSRECYIVAWYVPNIWGRWRNRCARKIDGGEWGCWVWPR